MLSAELSRETACTTAADVGDLNVRDDIGYGCTISRTCYGTNVSASVGFDVACHGEILYHIIIIGVEKAEVGS